jgi:hypothetical protein
MNALRDTGTLRRHDWHPEWNYTLNPPHGLSVSIIGRP